jgi:putative heme-binding domain-containing protein
MNSRLAGIDGRNPVLDPVRDGVTELPMKTKMRTAAVYTLVTLSAATLLGQRAQGPKNPLEGNAQAIANGKANFRANCSQCHGLEAKGSLRAPSLVSGHFARGGGDADWFVTIQHGVASTLMPANDLTEDETWEVIAFLHSIQPRSDTLVGGDAAIGEKYFSGNGGCSSCHMVRGQGGILGPDLSRVAASRSTAYIVESLREPSKQLSDGLFEPGRDSPIAYDTITVILADGKKIVGIPKNEDTFSIQLLDLAGGLQLFSKNDVRSVVHERKSLMPTYDTDKLPDAVLQDLLSYLETLSGK